MVDAGGEDLVEVAYANDPIEAEMIRGILEGEGIPSMLHPPGIDGTQLGAGLLQRGFDGGSRGVVVHASRLDEARELLAAMRSEGEDAAPARRRNYGAVGAYVWAFISSAGIVVLAYGIFTLLRAL